jgi:methylase of polypeptide subunit release factors
MLGRLVRTHEVDVDGHRLIVPPGVLDPVLFRSGAWFARKIAARVRPGERLLDLGTGSGVVSVLARAAGAVAVAVDIDPRACRAASANGVADVRRGDLYEPVRGERFDHVCMNPPYWRGPSLPLPFVRAMLGGRDLEIVRRFIAGAADALVPGGHGWMVLSDNARKALEIAAAAGWTTVEEERVFGERFTLWSSGSPKERPA